MSKKKTHVGLLAANASMTDMELLDRMERFLDRVGQFLFLGNYVRCPATEEIRRDYKILKLVLSPDSPEADLIKSGERKEADDDPDK